MLEELLAPIFMLGQRIFTEIQILYLLTILADYLHNIRELASVNIDVTQVQLLDVRQCMNHVLERLHEDELIKGQVTQAEPN